MTTTTVYRRDQTPRESTVNTALYTDPEAAKRRNRAALQDGIGSLRRAGTAVLAARNGDSKGLRDTLLSDVNRRIESMVRELRALE